MDSIVLGADVGGSHITAGLVDLKSGTILNDTLKRIRVKSDDTSENIIESWAAFILDVAKDHMQDLKIGMALPGPFDYEKGISLIKGLTKYESLYGKNVKELLADKLKISPASIRMKNDAGCFLQGEIFSGSAKGTDRSIGITLGTGVGTAYARQGIGEDAALWQAPLNDSIVEEWLSTRWFVKRYHQLTGKSVKDVKELCEKIDHDPAVKDIFKEFAGNLATFLAWFIKRDNPEIVVIGGNVAHAADLFLPTVVKLLSELSINIPIKISQLGEHAVILGSAATWSDQYQHTTSKTP